MATLSPRGNSGSGEQDSEREKDVPMELLRACYEAFAERRLRRGARSIRTRQGYERLCDKYQPRLRFLQEAAEANAPLSLPLSEPVQAPLQQQSGEPMDMVSLEASKTAARDSNEDDGNDEQSVLVAPPPREAATTEVQEVQHAVAEEPPLIGTEDSEASALKQLIGVFVDARVKRLVLETVWPLAHHGGRSDNEGAQGAKSRSVPEWQELEAYKYFAFMFKTLVWLFPGLPAFEAQEVAEYDWKKDCEFDAYGSLGLSFEGFMVSILDLALACTDSSTDKCIEFLKHLTKRLESSLPIFRIPTMSVLPSPANGDAESEPSKPNPNEPIVWRTIQLERLFPCPVRARPQFLELKAKLSLAPVVLMVLAGNERAMELQLSTSAKLLVREKDHRSSIRRNTMHTNALSHFIEIEKQFLWTFRSFPARPTLVIIPSGLVSKRTLSLYACCRLLESHEHARDQESSADVDPILTLFTAVQEPFPLLFGASNSLCGRVDRQSSRVFVVDHRGRESTSFKIIFKTSLIHNTSSAGGAGAAAIISSLAHVHSTGTARCKSELVGGGNSSSVQNAPHSFIFVVTVTSDLLANGPQRRRASMVGAGKGTSKSSEASVPAQWFTTLSGANENKTIYVDGSMDSDENSRGDGSVADMYYVYVFTLHGFYFEAVCEDHEDATTEATQASDDLPLPVLTHAEASKARSSTQAPPGSVLYAPDGDERAMATEIDGQEQSAPMTTTKSTVHNMTTSTALLRQLLHLRKQRQLRASAQPPPEYVGGSKITNVRTLTSAAGLRAKFLKARAEERRARFLQNEEEFQTKIISRLVKAETKKRAFNESDIQCTHDPSTAASPSSTLPADLEAKAALMVNFFKEMALYQPTQQELDEVEKAPLAQEEELLENFADLFHDDHALQNMMDEEKWMSVGEKTTRRQSLVDERMKTRRQSLVMLNKQQVPQLDDKDVGVSEALDIARKKSTTTRASEDYYSTAMLINQLMREAAEEENERAEADARDRTEEPNAQELEMLRQLTVSWRYAAHSTTNPTSSLRMDIESPSCGGNQEATGIELHRLEAVRRDDWFSSHHVTDTANNERLMHYRATLRPTLVPTRQHFEHQEEELPWQPIWEIQTNIDATQGVPSKSPQERTRPKTASCAVFAPRPPSSSIGTDRSPAVKAATLARRYTRRIRSAHSKSATQPRPTSETPEANAEASHEAASDRHQREPISHVPEIFLRRSYGVVVDENEAVDDSPCALSDLPVRNESALGVENVERGIGDIGCENAVKSDGGESLPTATDPLKRKPKRKKAKKLTNEERRFGGRVRELLSISPLLQSFVQPEL